MLKNKISMKSFLKLMILSFLWLTSCSSHIKYYQLSQDAFELYQSKEYLASAKLYTKAFELKNEPLLIEDHYNAACSWALSKNIDFAFEELFYIAKKENYSNIDHLLKDSDLNSLHNDQRWSTLTEIVSSNKLKTEALLDSSLVILLDTIYMKDQQYRSQMREIHEKYGSKSSQMQSLVKKIEINDSLNLIEVSKIIDKRGWLGTDVIGKKGNMTLFLVIQHANIQTQKKYLPIMKSAVKKGKASASNFAMLQDRVLIRMKKKQIYGSQVGKNKESGKYYVLPLRNPKSVNIRRAKMGLYPLEDYLSHWNIRFNPITYKNPK